jgi:hypothetical protein
MGRGACKVKSVALAFCLASRAVACGFQPLPSSVSVPAAEKT